MPFDPPSAPKSPGSEYSNPPFQPPWTDVLRFLRWLESVALEQAPDQESERVCRTKRAFWSLRQVLGPDPKPKEHFLAATALTLGMQVAFLDVDGLKEAIRQEKERRVRGGKGRAAVKEEHRADVEARAALLMDQNPTWSNARVCRDMCVWYKLEHGRTASESAMERALGNLFRRRKSNSVRC